MIYPTEVVLSVTTGVLLCKFSDMHKLAEYLVGGPVFTHQFAYKPFLKELVHTIHAQHPELVGINAEGVTRENWQQFRDAKIAELGPSFEILPMSQLSASFTASLTEPLKGKQVLAVGH